VCERVIWESFYSLSATHTHIAKTVNEMKNMDCQVNCCAEGSRTDLEKQISASVCVCVCVCVCKMQLRRTE